jgi:uncharacterized phage protein (TIGR01671 family)
MSREVKFRALEKNLKEIIPVHNINFVNRMINTGSAWRLFDEIELMQYTGLKDKNGNEIYEGDIVSGESYETSMARHWGNDVDEKEKCYEIQFIRGSFRLCDVESKNWVAVIDHHVMSKVENLVVIGNIYDNSNLLEGEK